MCLSAYFKGYGFIMFFRIFTIILLVLIIASCNSTKSSYLEKPKVTIVTTFPQLLNNNGTPVIYGSSKEYSNRFYKLAVAQLVDGNKLASIQELSEGRNKISILISNESEFITAETDIYTVSGFQYFVNFEFKDPRLHQSKYTNAPFIVERIWITNSLGSIIKELVFWSDSRQIRELYTPNIG